MEVANKQRRNKIDDDRLSQSSENFEIDYSSSPSKNSQSSTKSISKRKTHLRHFPHLEPEHVLKRYSCALASDFLRQGYLYVTDNYFAFYSNIFGYVTKLLIPIQSVEEITKEKTAKIIPNAIGILIGKEKHVFSSLIQRDNSYAFMRKIWQGVKNDSGQLSDFDSDSLYSTEEETPINDDLHTEDGEVTFSSNTKTIVTTKRTLSNLVWYSTIISIILLVLMSGVLLYKIIKVQNKFSSIPTTEAKFQKNLFRDNPDFLGRSYVSINEFVDKNVNVLSVTIIGNVL